MVKNMIGSMHTRKTDKHKSRGKDLRREACLSRLCVARRPATCNACKRLIRCAHRLLLYGFFFCLSERTLQICQPSVVILFIVLPKKMSQVVARRIFFAQHQRAPQESDCRASDPLPRTPCLGRIRRSSGCGRVGRKWT